MVSNNFMEIQMSGGSLNLEILTGGGLKQFWKSRWKGGSKNCAFRRGGVDFFWNNPIMVCLSFIEITDCFYCIDMAVIWVYKCLWMWNQAWHSLSNITIEHIRIQLNNCSSCAACAFSKRNRLEQCLKQTFGRINKLLIVSIFQDHIFN